MLATVTTDSQGRFAITFKPQLTGSIVMRVVVDPAGRYLEVIGLPKPVRLLTLSSISLKGGGLVTNQIPVTFAVAVDPPSLGRTVRLEQSSDKVHWVPVGPSAQTQADGKTVIRMPGLAVGIWSYRATVAQDDKFAAAVSPLAGATVEDIKVVAARAAAAPLKAVAELARQEEESQCRSSGAAADGEAGKFTGIWNSHGGQLVVQSERVCDSGISHVRLVQRQSDAALRSNERQPHHLRRARQHALFRSSRRTACRRATAIVDTSSDPKIQSGSQQNFEAQRASSPGQTPANRSATRGPAKPVLVGA